MLQKNLRVDKMPIHSSGFSLRVYLSHWALKGKKNPDFQAPISKQLQMFKIQIEKKFGI